MNDTCKYSVVIRTLGNTGEKYRQTLEAVAKQTVKPMEIIVAIPDGYTLDHRLGNERIIRCQKGMVSQRAAGIENASSDYLLVIDDDINIPPNFVEEMYRTILSKQLDCVLAFGGGNAKKRLSRKDLLKQAFQCIRGAFTGQVFSSFRKCKFFDVIASTGGHRTYVNCPEGLCQTGCFQCFFIKSDKAKAVKFDEEVWLEQGRLSSYAAYDDAVFFYKMYLNGGRIAYTTNTDYTHLDAAVGRPALDHLSAKKNRLYTIARNRTIFWHRHIWSNHRSLRNFFGGMYGVVNYAIYNIVTNPFPKQWPAIKALLNGYADAYAFIKRKG